QIYRTQANRSWCKERGIRLSGPPLGRPKQDKTLRAEQKRQAREDEKRRVAIEGKFGQAKRRFSLSRVMPKLAETAQCAIAITFLVLNLERWLRQLLWCLFYGLGIDRRDSGWLTACSSIAGAIFTLMAGGLLATEKSAARLETHHFASASGA
ncbi:MAG: transposase, partial [Cyanobacteria bacterium J06598_1]